MRNITNEIAKPLVPKAVLVAYKREESGYYLESHEVLDDGTVGAAKGVSRELMQKIATSFASDSVTAPHGIMPCNLLYADTRPLHNTYVWWNAPRRRVLTFTRQAGLPDGEYSMPGVVYMARGTDLWVYAFAGKTPRLKSRLLMGPFFNYYEDCKLCLGTARRVFPKDGSWEEHLLAWENIFWNSANAHTISRPVQGDLTDVLRRTGAEPFDTALCRKTDLTLEKLLSRLR